MDKFGRNLPEKTEGYLTPGVATDCILIKDNKILLIQRLKKTFQDCWAIPGGFVDYNEEPHLACIRELKEETSLIAKSEPILVGVYGKPLRDPRKHVISITYHIKEFEGILKAKDDAKDAKWVEIKEILDEKNELKLAFDHEEIIKDFVKKFNIKY